MPMTSSFGNHLLIAMPSLIDNPFHRAVVFVCQHQPEGSLGFIINRPMDFSLGFVFNQLQIEPKEAAQNEHPLLFGGPIQSERGFVIHRPGKSWRSSTMLGSDVSITTSRDILKAIASQEGPDESLIMLGYSGWGANQLEEEVLDNTWLICPYKSELLYEVPFDKRWEYAASTIGVKISQLISTSGHA